MATKLMEIWIIDKSGLSLVHTRSPQIMDKPAISPVLFSGFLTAVESVAAEAIDAIKMKDSKIMILPIQKPSKFFVVGRAKIREKDSNIRKVLLKISELFVDEFGVLISSWNGDHQIFEFFKDHLQKFLI
ncbi:MAG: hypothetical protein K9W44_13260 [Candidatus Lokiarchaeota archaeon]|nr:hypothetical protein [Candidatus Harpocratesius repetitus]